MYTPVKTYSGGEVSGPFKFFTSSWFIQARELVCLRSDFLEPPTKPCSAIASRSPKLLISSIQFCWLSRTCCNLSSSRPVACTPGGSTSRSATLTGCAMVVSKHYACTCLLSTRIMQTLRLSHKHYAYHTNIMMCYANITPIKQT